MSDAVTVPNTSEAAPTPEVETFVCSVRGTTHPVSERIETADGEYICQTEYDEGGWFTCSVRDEVHPDDERIETADGEYICQDEYDANWFTSDHDDGVYHNDDACSACNEHGRTITVSSDQRDEEYRHCDETGDYYPRDSMMMVSGSARRRGVRWISRTAYENGGYFTCDHCGEVYHEDDYGGDSCCNECYDGDDDDDDSGSGVRILSYGTGEPPGLDEARAEPLVRRYGTELECVADGVSRVRAALSFDDAFGWGRNEFAIYRTDGSLPHDTGFEIVTRPALLTEHQETWARALALNHGCVSWDNPSCGMHVHVGRKALSQLQIGKMLCFLHAPETMGFVTFIAGRASNTYCSRPPKKVSDSLKSEGRYVALNLTNDDTVEVRIFRGTLNVRRLLANIEFVDALCEWTLPGNSSLMTTKDHRAFCTFVADRRKTWPNLMNRLVDAGYVTGPKPAKGSSPKRDRSKPRCKRAKPAAPAKPTTNSVSL